jgi:hypothetical protein
MGAPILIVAKFKDDFDQTSIFSHLRAAEVVRARGKFGYHRTDGRHLYWNLRKFNFFAFMHMPLHINISSKMVNEKPAIHKT